MATRQRTDGGNTAYAKHALGATDVTDDEWTTTLEEFGEEIKFERSGDMFTGIYESVKVVELQQLNDKTGELETRPTNNYLFRDADGSGKAWSLWGSFNVDKGMAEVPVGSLVRIVFVGTAALKGGRSVKEYRIAYRSK